MTFAMDGAKPGSFACEASRSSAATTTGPATSQKGADCVEAFLSLCIVGALGRAPPAGLDGLDVAALRELHARAARRTGAATPRYSFFRRPSRRALVKTVTSLLGGTAARTAVFDRVGLRRAIWAYCDRPGDAPARAAGRSGDASNDGGPGGAGGDARGSPASPDRAACLGGDSTVVVSGSRHPVRVDALEPGDRVLTGTGDYRRVVRIWTARAGDGDVVAAVSDGCRLIPGHPIFVGNTWVRCGALRRPTVPGAGALLYGGARGPRRHAPRRRRRRRRARGLLRARLRVERPHAQVRAVRPRRVRRLRRLRPPGRGLLRGPGV
jgi:hypothetical protein